MVAQHEALIAGLISLMDAQEDWDRNWEAARSAAFLLGEMRAVAAAPVLAQFVDSGHRHPLAHFSEGAAWEDYLWRMPAVRALVQIGEPSLDDVVERIGDDSPGVSGSMPAYCVRVLVELRGVDGAAICSWQRSPPSPTRSAASVSRSRCACCSSTALSTRRSARIR